MSASPPIAVKHWHRSETPLRAISGHGPLLVSGKGRRPSNLGVLGCPRLLAKRNFSGRILMRMLSRRCLLLGALIAPWAAHAQNWPAGNIKIVVPYPPGGSTDMLARLVHRPISNRLGPPSITETRPAGAGGS